MLIHFFICYRSLIINIFWIFLTTSSLISPRRKRKACFGWKISFDEWKTFVKISLKLFSHHDQNIFFCKTLCQSLSSPRPRVASRVSAATWKGENNIFLNLEDKYLLFLFVYFLCKHLAILEIQIAIATGCWDFWICCKEEVDFSCDGKITIA